MPIRKFVPPFSKPRLGFERRTIVEFHFAFFPPLVPTYLSVETTRTGRVLSWIIRKKERKKKKRKQEKYRLLRRFYYHRFYYRPWSISRARTGPPTGVFNAARDSAGLLLSRITWNLWDPTRGDDFIIRDLYSVRERVVKFLSFPRDVELYMLRKKSKFLRCNCVPDVR